MFHKVNTILSFKKNHLIANWELLYYEKEIVMHLNFSVGRNRTFMWNLVIKQKYVLGDCSKETNLSLIDKTNVGDEATDRSGQALVPISACSQAPPGEQQPGSVLPSQSGRWLVSGCGQRHVPAQEHCFSKTCFWITPSYLIFFSFKQMHGHYRSFILYSPLSKGKW